MKALLTRGEAMERLGLSRDRFEALVDTKRVVRVQAGGKRKGLYLAETVEKTRLQLVERK